MGFAFMSIVVGVVVGAGVYGLTHNPVLATLGFIIGECAPFLFILAFTRCPSEN